MQGLFMQSFIHLYSHFFCHAYPQSFQGTKTITNSSQNFALCPLEVGQVSQLAEVTFRNSDAFGNEATLGTATKSHLSTKALFTRAGREFSGTKGAGASHERFTLCLNMKYRKSLNNDYSVVVGTQWISKPFNFENTHVPIWIRLSPILLPEIQTATRNKATILLEPLWRQVLLSVYFWGRGVFHCSGVATD